MDRQAAVAAQDNFIAELNAAWEAAGPPSYARLERLSLRVSGGLHGLRLRVLAASTTQAILSGRRKRLPEWGWVASFVNGLRLAAAENGLDPDVIGTIQEWKAKHHAVRLAPARQVFPQSWSGRNCSIVLTDIVGFGSDKRDDFDRQMIRRQMYELLRDAFERSNVPWTTSYREDRGGGMLIVVPPTVPTASIVDPLVVFLAASLRRHNDRSSEAVRIQLRLALNVGPVTADRDRVTGESIIRTARLVEAPVLKEQLAITAADLGVIVSSFVHDTVVTHGSGQVDPANYHRVSVQVNRSKLTAWMRLARAESLSPNQQPS
ncbi:MAG TPA: hypothetical protein VFU43_30710 [Streptosporangiaceae bacterium]|nr:hypothetical protein [Streptosporangiaceae bacterium]